jgi:hypothetical protein
VYRALAAVALSAASARADGVYFSQAIGIGDSSQPTIGRAIHARASIGARVRWLAVEPWVTSDTQFSREGAWRGLIGGDPADGYSDLAQYGVDVKAIVPLHRTQSSLVEGYLRGGGSIASATGALDGYRGYGLGGAAGFQVRGRVRALGFLWGPLFFVNRGPRVTGALFVEHGEQLVELSMGSSRVSTRVGHTTLGFAVGSSF